MGALGAAAWPLGLRDMSQEQGTNDLLYKPSRVQVGIVGKRNSTGVAHRELSSAGRTGRKRCDAPPAPSDWWT